MGEGVTWTESNYVIQKLRAAYQLRSRTCQVPSPRRGIRCPDRSSTEFVAMILGLSTCANYGSKNAPNSHVLLPREIIFSYFGRSVLSFFLQPHLETRHKAHFILKFASYTTYAFTWTFIRHLGTQQIFLIGKYCCMFLLLWKPWIQSYWITLSTSITLVLRYATGLND